MPDRPLERLSYQLRWVAEAAKAVAVPAPFVFLSIADREFFAKLWEIFRSDDDDDGPFDPRLLPARLIRERPSGGDMFAIEFWGALAASLIILWLISRPRRQSAGA
jgi:hypothetical protein